MWFDLSGDLRRDFLGIQNNLKICGSAHVSQQHSSANKIQPNLFAVVLIFKALHCICFIKPVI